MTFSASSTSGVFCDWLDVTYSPTDFPYRELTRFLNDADGRCSFSDSSSESWELGDGVLKLEQRARFARVSASGSVLSYLRAKSLFHNYLWLLADSPHRVTRCDVALDLPIDGAKVVRSLRRRYPQECKLTRKPQRTKSILQARASDGVQTGTFYIGHRGKGKVTARVYDKAHEAFENRKQDLPPTTRFEITVGKDMYPSLKDAGSPEAMFWHFAAPSLLKRPSGVPEWVPCEVANWTMPQTLIAPAEVLKRRVENSADLSALLVLAEQVGPGGYDYLLTLLDKRVKSHARHNEPMKQCPNEAMS